MMIETEITQRDFRKTLVTLIGSILILSTADNSLADPTVFVNGSEVITCKNDTLDVSLNTGVINITCDNIDNSSNPSPTNPSPTNPSPTNPSPTNPSPTNPSPTNPVSSDLCPNPESDVEFLNEIDIAGGKRFRSQFIIRQPGSILAAPYKTGNTGEIINWRSAEGNVGNAFYTTIVISRCPGVFEPYRDVLDTEQAACTLSGRNITSVTVVGEKDVEGQLFPGAFKCFLKPQTQYYATIYQRDPWVNGDETYRNTCEGNVKCGLILDFKNTANLYE